MKTAFSNRGRLEQCNRRVVHAKPKCGKGKRGIEVARKKLLDLAESQSGRDPLLEAKRKLALVYLGMAKDKFSDTDTDIFSMLAKERALQDELERARKNN